METVEVDFRGQPMFLVIDTSSGDPIHFVNEAYSDAPRSGKQEDCEEYIKRNLH